MKRRCKPCRPLLSLVSLLQHPLTLGEMLPSLAGVQEAGTSVVCAFWSEGLRRLGDLGEVLRNACPIW